MVDDVSYHLRQPETKEESVLAKCELGIAAMNQGAAACVDWSFVDYPDPFVIEDGDTPAERAAYAAGKCGYRMDTKYNKCGVFRWSTTDKDYSSYAELYAMGWLVKLFRKNATVLPCAFADPMLRGGAVINPDRRRRGDQPGPFRFHRAHQPRPREDRERGLLVMEDALGWHAVPPPAAAPLRVRGRARAVQSVQ